MSVFCQRFILAFIGGMVCGFFIPSLSGDRWLLAWSILIAYSLAQSFVLAIVLPERES